MSISSRGYVFSPSGLSVSLRPKTNRASRSDMSSFKHNSNSTNSWHEPFFFSISSNFAIQNFTLHIHPMKVWYPIEVDACDR